MKNTNIFHSFHFLIILHFRIPLHCSYFLIIPIFITKHKRPNLICLTYWLSFQSKNSVPPLFLIGDMVEDPTADRPWCILWGIHRKPLLSRTSAQFFLCAKLMSFLNYLLLNNLSKERMCTNSLTLQSPNGRSLCVQSKWLVFNWRLLFCDLKDKLIIISTIYAFPFDWNKLGRIPEIIPIEGIHSQHALAIVHNTRNSAPYSFFEQCTGSFTFRRNVDALAGNDFEARTATGSELFS